MTLNVLVTVVFVTTLLKVNDDGVTVRGSTALPFNVTVFDWAPPPLMVTVAVWLGLFDVYDVGWCIFSFIGFEWLAVTIK